MAATKVQRRLLWLQILHVIIENIGGIFLSLYLWKFASLQVLLQFRFLELLIIPFMALLVGLIIDKISPKISLLMGVGLYGVVVVAVLMLQSEVINWLVPIAAMSGASAVSRFMSFGAFIESAIKKEDQTAFYSQSSTFSQLFSVIFPIVSGSLVASFGYSPLFAVALALMGLMVVLVLPVTSTIKHNAFQPWLIMTHFNAQKRTVTLTHLLFGMEFAVLMTLVPILIAQTFAGEFGWGVVTTMLSLLAVGYMQLLKKIKDSQGLLALVAVLALVIAGMAVVYAADPFWGTFLGLMVVIKLWQTTQGVAMIPLLNQVASTDPDQEKLHLNLIAEYRIWMEVPFMAGRAIMLGFLWMIASDLTQPVVLSLLFGVLALIPLYEVKVLASQWLGKPEKLSSSWHFE